MYTFILVLSILAVVLSPIAIDWLLTLHETRRARHAWRAQRRKGPQLVWASPRPR